MGRWSDISVESFALVAPPVVVHTDVTTRGRGKGDLGGLLLPLTCLSWCKFAQFVALSLCLLWYLRALWRAQAAAREGGTGGGGSVSNVRGN